MQIDSSYIRVQLSTTVWNFLLAVPRKHPCRTRDWSMQTNYCCVPLRSFYCLNVCVWRQEADPGLSSGRWQLPCASSSAVMPLVPHLVPFIPRWINAFAAHPYSFSLVGICSSVLCEPCPRLQGMHIWCPQSIGGVQLSTCRNLSFSILNAVSFLSSKLKYLMENTTSSCWLGLSNMHCWEVQNTRREWLWAEPTGTKHYLLHILLPAIGCCCHGGTHTYFGCPKTSLSWSHCYPPPWRIFLQSKKQHREV